MSESVLLFGRDSPFMLRLSEHIRSKKCKVHFAQTGPEGLGIIQRNDIDVVVINVNDLETEVVQILDSIKQTQPLTEFITLTSPTTIHWSIEGMKRGAFADLIIPFDLEDLVARIREAGARRKARKRRRKKSLRTRLEDLMVSATFAESGSFDAARQIIEEGQKRKDNLKKEQDNEKS